MAVALRELESRVRGQSMKQSSSLNDPSPPVGASHVVATAPLGKAVVWADVPKCLDEEKVR